MLQRIINYSLKNKFIILLATVALVAGGIYALRNIALDAIPDLSDVEVIAYTPWPGQAPQIIQDQVTYPITIKMLSVPGAKVVRGYSFYGYSFVYVIFKDGTDLYWARSRVLEYLSGLAGTLPQGVSPSLGPDATGVGWAFMYTLDSTNRDLAQLRSLQDWYVRYALASVPGVSEVASIGGFVRQYQVTVDPDKLRAYHLSIAGIARAIRRSNNEVGGRSIELAETEFILRVKGYIESLHALRQVAVGVGKDGVPILLRDVATVQFGPEMRRGIAELNGQGETVGGIVEVRFHDNTYKIIQAVKKKLAQEMKSLPPDVKVTVVYDRTALIDRAVRTLEEKVLEECAVVALVCLAFLFHLRSSLVAIIFLPVAVLMSFFAMFEQGLSSNIMSLGGIAIAIGAMVDAVIVMIENAHKHLEHEQGQKPHWDIIRDAAVEVGPTLFYSLLVITVSFLPVFTLGSQEGRLFKPLAFTKSYSMAAAAILSVTLAPILMGFFIRGRIPREESNPLNRLLIWLYHPLIDLIIKWRWWIVTISALAVVWVFLPWNMLVKDLLPHGHAQQIALKAGKLFPYQNLGSEFMPPLYEGDLLYMPSAFPSLSVTKARQLLQVTDKIIESFPEVKTVFGKAGRAETATDPAGMEMFETTIQLKPESEWPAVDIKDDSGRVIAHRPYTPDELKAALNAAIEIPGLQADWTMPIKTRIDMLSTGIKTPVGIKVAGPDLAKIQHIAEQIEGILRPLPHTTSAYAERVMGGHYIVFHINRDAIARYGLTIGDVQDVLQVALGGMPLTTTVQGLERYTINLRYNRDFRSNLRALKHDVVIPTPTGAQVPLGELADIKVEDGPGSIKTEAAVPQAWIYVDIAGIDVGTYVQNAQAAINRAISKGEIKLPPGYNIYWSGQYEYMMHARQRLMVVVPVTLLIITLIIYLNTRSAVRTAIVMLSVPFSLVGSFWWLYWLHYNMSVAVWVGMIALAGVSAETGVVMLLYLELAFDEWTRKGQMRSLADLRDAIYHGAVKRVRPKAMTAAVIIAGLVPILLSHGTGADVMKRIAVPMVGGIVTSTILELIVFPAIYYLWRSRAIRRENQPPPGAATAPEPAPAI